jgi:hypothetical protein
LIKDNSSLFLNHLILLNSIGLASIAHKSVTEEPGRAASDTE